MSPLTILKISLKRYTILYSKYQIFTYETKFSVLHRLEYKIEMQMDANPLFHRDYFLIREEEKSEKSRVTLTERSDIQYRSDKEIFHTRPNSCLVSYRTIWLSPGNTSRPRDTCVNPFCPTGDTGWWRAHCHSKIAPKAMPAVVLGTNRRGARIH